MIKRIFLAAMLLAITCGGVLGVNIATTQPVYAADRP
jgi:hypothetical protein